MLFQLNDILITCFETFIFKKIHNGSNNFVVTFLIASNSNNPKEFNVYILQSYIHFIYNNNLVC